jgi:hypothetical protein
MFRGVSISQIFKKLALSFILEVIFVIFCLAGHVFVQLCNLKFLLSKSFEPRRFSRVELVVYLKALFHHVIT